MLFSLLLDVAVGRVSAPQMGTMRPYSAGVAAFAMVVV